MGGLTANSWFVRLYNKFKVFVINPDIEFKNCLFLGVFFIILYVILFIINI